MTKIDLVLLTGFPAVGKSTVAKRLSVQYNFTILSTDDLRQSIFGRAYTELVKDKKRREEVIRKILDYSKLQLLRDSHDLVIDCSAPTEKFRRRMLDLPEVLEQLVKRSILHIRADEEIVRSRQETRGDLYIGSDIIQKYWKSPQDGFMGSTLYEIENNDDIEDLYGKLDRFYEGLKK